jgi:exopolysaccharide biosynthesis polyprenyl glycosylphosphotransferase
MILRILHRDIPLRHLLFVLGEGILIYLAVMMAVYLRFGGPTELLLSPEIIGKALLIMIVCQVSLYFNDLYNLELTNTYLEIGLRLTNAIGIASIILAILYYCIPSLRVGRGIFFISLAFLALLIVSWRYAYNWILKKKMFTEKIFLLGTGELSRKILNEVNGHRDSGYQVAGLIPVNSGSSPALPPDIPLFDINGRLSEFAESNHIKKIVVALDDRRGHLPMKELLRCKMSGVTILEGESFYEKLAGRILADNVNPSSLIFADGFKKSKLRQITKRAFGLVFAGLGLLMTLPLTLIIPLAIKLDSKGPVIYRQKRCGEKGRIFELCKFRSMVHDAEVGCGPTWAQDNDRRVTRVGKVLRKYRLDEIPQMWNVLKGDMSFVGPRPERPEFVEELERIIPYYSERQALEKLKYDLFYVKNMSMFMDLAIIFKTIKIVLLRTGAR